MRFSLNCSNELEKNTLGQHTNFFEIRPTITRNISPIFKILFEGPKKYKGGCYTNQAFFFAKWEKLIFIFLYNSLNFTMLCLFDDFPSPVLTSLSEVFTYQYRLRYTSTCDIGNAPCCVYSCAKLAY